MHPAFLSVFTDAALGEASGSISAGDSMPEHLGDDVNDDGAPKPATGKQVDQRISDSCQRHYDMGKHFHVDSSPGDTPLLPDRLFHGFLDRFDGLLNGLLGVADRLVGPSLRAKLVVAGQCASSFLDSTFRHVCFATHNGDSFF
jgi:hypothetical protein